MQAWSFPRTSKLVHKHTDIMKDNTQSQALNNRLADDPVFFVYDHNMLKKEEDDLKDAILYFAPEFMSADDQCALCGQLMGMVEFLGASISQSAPAFFKFDQEKFALKQIGSYSFGLQASVSVPDSVMSEQLMSLYEVFVTFHGSVDSVRLRFKDSHSQFLKEFGAIWRVILQVSNVSLHSTLYQTFNHVPYVHLPKSGSHLFLQASHLLQASQRRPFVLAGAIFYKNKVLCTQLSPALTRHLTFLQNQIPYIARNTDSDMPKGCKIITMFLTDDELRQITPVHSNTSPHCKSTNFYQPAKKKPAETTPKLSRKLTRRQTYSSIPAMSKPSTSLTEQTSKRLVTNEQLKSFYGRQEALRVEQSTWGKNKSKLHLSHVPLVECRGGESPTGETPATGEGDKGARKGENQFGQTYQQLELKQHLDSFTLVESVKSTNVTKTHTQNVHLLPDIVPLKNNPGMDKYDNEKGPTEDCDSNGKDRPNSTHEDEDSSTKLTDSMHEDEDSSTKLTDSTHEDEDSSTKLTDSTHEDEDSSTKLTDVEEADYQNGVPEIKIESEESNTKDTEVIDSKGLEDQIMHINNSLHSLSTKTEIISEETNGMVVENTEEIHKGEETSDSNIRIGINRSESNDGAFITETDNSDTEVSVNVEDIDSDANVPVFQDDNTIKIGEPRLVSESDVSETEDELEIVADSFIPCIACLDLNEGHAGRAKCKKCESQPSVREVIVKTGERQEILDFGKKVVVNDSDGDEVETQSDVEGRHFYTANSESIMEKSALSSFSSDVSTDSTISRYWTYEMEGLNDVTLYIQCHSEISLLLLMENPKQYEENLFHSLWKGSLAHLADLDYYITECIENEESSDNPLNYKYARFDVFSSELNTNIEDVAVKRRETHLPQMLGVIHSDFKDRQCLTDITLRSQSSCCYGHHSEGDETYFQPELTNRPVSGLPVSRDPVSNLDGIARQRLSEDKKLTLL